MNKTIFDTFNKKNATAYMNTKVYTPRIFPALFPVKSVAVLSYETIIGSNSRPVAADVIAYDSKAPRKTRKVLSKLKGEIPQIAIAREMSTVQLNKYNELMAFAAMGRDGAESQMIDMIYDDVDFCIDGDYARQEWLCLQAASAFEIALTAANNDGVITEDNIDFQLPAANKRKVKSASSNRAWTTANITTATPFTDIDVIVETFLPLGLTFQNILIERSVFVVVKKCSEVKQAIWNDSATVRIPTLAQVNEYMAAQGLPTFIIINSYVDIEDAAGDKTTTNCWNTDYTTFIPNTNLGNVLSGPVAEYESKLLKDSGATIVKNNDGIVLQKWANMEPLTENTKAIWNAFPSFPAVDMCVRFAHTGYDADGLDD